jgi:hypothetical protein
MGAILAAMDTYSRAERAMGWLGAALALVVLVISLDVALGGRLSGRYDEGEPESEAPADAGE